MTKSKKGFTIIEVVLVLAIAGLIFLMVFIALPALQRSQRNTRRRSDMARILSAFTEYQSNNGGKMPTSTDQIETFIKKYASGNNACGTSVDGNKISGDEKCGDQFVDPDGTPYSIKLAVPGTGGAIGFVKPSDTFDHIIYYNYTAMCDNDAGEGELKQTKGKNDIALLYYLEGGAIYCGDNQ